MKRLISISLALMLLLGNVGVTYGTHFCGGHAIISELMLGHEHMDCGMAMMEMPEAENGDSVTAPECCSNEYVSPETDKAIKHHLSQDLTPTLVIIALANELFEISWEAVDTQKHYLSPSPPIPDQDLNTLYQVFII